MKDTYSPKEFGKLIGKAVVTLQKWDRKGILERIGLPQIGGIINMSSTCR
jgi:hypothetical protein